MRCIGNMNLESVLLTHTHTHTRNLTLTLRSSIKSRIKSKSKKSPAESKADVIVTQVHFRFLRMHWDHEQHCGQGRAGVSPAQRALTREQESKSVVGFADGAGETPALPCSSCPHSFFRMYWDPEPLAVPLRSESTDKSDALRTLRALGRVIRRRGSVLSACVFSAAFPMSIRRGAKRRRKSSIAASDASSIARSS